MEAFCERTPELRPYWDEWMQGYAPVANIKWSNRTRTPRNLRLWDEQFAAWKRMKNAYLEFVSDKAAV